MDTGMSDGQRTLRRWMIAVGIFYLVIGIRLLPWINGPMIEAIGLEQMYVGGDIEVGSTAWHFVLDWMATFGLALIPFGAVLLVAAREPVRNRLLVHLVIAHEAIVGIVDDLWFISRDYVTNGVMYGWIVVHTIVIISAIWVLRRTAAAEERVAVELAAAG